MNSVRRLLVLLIALLLGATSSRAALVIADSGKARCVILQDTNATPAERHAASELAQTLKQVTGGTFEIQAGEPKGRQSAIVVGPGPTASKLFPEIDLSKLGAEEYIMRVKGRHLLLAGGRPRGTVYAVDRFLQQQCGVRWWTPWASTLPKRPNLRIGDLNERSQPAFEYRAPFWSSAFDPAWKARNGANGESARIPDDLGGCVSYKGFAHTFYQLVPPEKHFAEHPEWFSLIKGKRTHENAQLCLTNPKLRDFVVERVKEWLRESPDAGIVSVTQNDCHGACECPDCQALDDAESSHAGTMIEFVNYIAEKIEPEFPNVAVDTFAYQYTRKPPRTLKPRPNVIVRLCSIECNFREPLDHASNASFLSDLDQWSKICHRLYIWDYVTDFSAYVYPHPNWFVLGPNLRLFQQYGVKGVFEEGAYGGPGSEMAELRAWVLAQLLWNPKQDDSALIDEFLAGYYGPAAKPIRRYLDLMQKESSGFYLGCFLRKDPPHLKFQPLARAEKLWQQAEQAVAGDPELSARVRLAHLPVRNVWLRDWVALRNEARKLKADWPLSPSRKVVADEWREVARGIPGKDWTVVQKLNEPGLTVDQFLAPLASDPVETANP